MLTSIQAFFTALAEYFKMQTSSNENASELTVNKNTKNGKKACDTAEEILLLNDDFLKKLENYLLPYQLKELDFEKFNKKYIQLKKKFLKYT